VAPSFFTARTNTLCQKFMVRSGRSYRGLHRRSESYASAPSRRLSRTDGSPISWSDWCSREEPSRPIIPANAKRRNWHIPFQTRSRARDIKKKLAHVHVFCLNASNEPVSARKSFVCGIARSAGLGLKVLARLGCDWNEALPLARTCLSRPSDHAHTYCRIWERFSACRYLPEK